MRAASPSANSPSPSAASPMSSFAQAFSMKKRLSDSITDSWSRRRPSLPHGSSTGSVPSTSSRLKDAPSTNTNSYHATSTPATSATSNTNNKTSSSSHSSKSRTRSSSATTATAQHQAQNHYSQGRSNTLTSSTSIGTLTSSSSASSISGYIGGGISRQESYTDMSRAFPQPPTPLGGGGGATQGWDRRLDGIDSPTVPVYENMVVHRVSSRPIAGPADLKEVDEIIDESVDSYGADEHFTRNQENAAASQRAAADVGMRRMSSGLTRKISDSRRILTGPLPVEEPRSPLSQSESAGVGGTGIQSRKIYTNQQTLLGLPPNFNARDSTMSDTPSTVRGYEPSSDDDSTTSSMMSMAMRSPSQGLPQTMPFSQSSRGSSRTQHSSPHGSEYRGLSEKTSMSAIEKLSSRPQGGAGNGPSRSMTASPGRSRISSMSSVNLRSLSVTPASGSTARVSSIGQRDTSGSAIAVGGASLTRASSIALSPTSRSDSNSSTTSTTLETTTSSSSTKDRSHAANASTVRGKNPTIQPTSALKQTTTILPIPDAASAPKVAKAPASGMYWYKAPTHGMTHEPLRAHSCTLLGSNIYVFGGCNTKCSFNDLQVFDADSMSWSQPQVRGEFPPPLRAMTTTAVRNKLVIFGGGDGPTYFNDVYVYDTVTGRYTKPPLGSAQQPVRRRAHTACLYKNGIYVFGGGDGVKALNDVWRLDVTDLNKPYWDLISPNSSPRPSKPTSSSRHHISEDEPKPKPRGYHTANMVGSKLIVYGGSDGEECFQDVWVFDLDTALWKQVDIKKSYSRLSHTSTVIGSCLFVVGGHDGVAYSSEVLLLNLVTMQWDRRKVYGKPPGGRGYHCAVLYDSRLFVLGGFDG